MKKDRILCIISGCLIAAMLFCATACSRDSTDKLIEETSAVLTTSIHGDAPYGTNLETGISTDATIGQGKRVLRVSQCFDYYNLEDAIGKFKAIHPDVEIVLNKYDNDIESYMQGVITQLISGEADDVMDATGITDGIPFSSSLLADFYPLINNDQNFNREDYFMNVFDGMAYNNRLVEFPVCFNYNVIGVNNSFSQELVDRFKRFASVSYRELFDLYHSLPDKGGMYMSRNIDAITAVNANINTFVDYANKTCNFNTEYFINFINDAKSATAQRKIEEEELNYLFGKYMSIANQEECAQQYLFDDAFADDFLVFFPLSDKEIFTHYIPETNDEGKLILVPVKRLCISEASQNKELAWEFIKFLSMPQANQNIVIPSFPVHREVYKAYVAANIEPAVEHWRTEGYNIDGETGEIIERVTDVLLKFNEMPMEYQRYVVSIDDIFMEVLVPFYLDRITAEQAALELQNRVSQHLIEMQ